MASEARNAGHCILNDFAEYFLQPSHDAAVTRSCLYKAYEHSTNPDADLLSKHIYSTGWMGMAWTNSFFDTISFTGKTLSTVSFAIVRLDYDEITAHLRSEGREVLSAAIRIFVLPFCIFTGLFIPESIYGKFNYPSQNASEEPVSRTIQALAADLRTARESLEQAVNETQTQRETITRLENELETYQNSSQPNQNEDLLQDALTQNGTLQERIVQLERDLQTAQAAQNLPQPNQNQDRLQQTLDQNAQLQATITQLQADLQAAQRNANTTMQLQQQIDFLTSSNQGYINSILSVQDEKNRAVREKADLNTQLDQIINTVTPMRLKANMQVYEERWKALEDDPYADLKAKLNYQNLLKQKADLRWLNVKTIYLTDANVQHSIHQIEANNPLFN